MKKLLTVITILAMLLSLPACSDTDSSAESENTSAPASGPQVITLDEVKDIIDTVKSEYAAADEMKMSDGTVVSAEIKDPGITIDDVKNGTATDEQKNDYMKYLYNIRILTADRLSSSFAGENRIISDNEEGKTITYIFLDPKADGFANAVEAAAEMYRKQNEDEDAGIVAVSDFIYIDNSVILFWAKETNEVDLLCPSPEENTLLSEIMK